MKKITIGLAIIFAVAFTALPCVLAEDAGTIRVMLETDSAKLDVGEEFDLRIRFDCDADVLPSGGIEVAMVSVKYDSTAFEPVSAGTSYVRSGAIIPAGKSISSATAENSDPIITMLYGDTSSTNIVNKGIFAVIRFKTLPTAPNKEVKFTFNKKPSAVSSLSVEGTMVPLSFNIIAQETTVDISTPYNLSMNKTTFEQGETLTISGSSTIDRVSYKIYRPDNSVMASGNANTANGSYQVNIPIAENAPVGVYKLYVINGFNSLDTTFSVTQKTTPTQPDDTTPGDNTPGDNTPGDTTPGDNTPGDNTPGDTTPGDTTPGDTTPGDNTPGDNTPGDNTPGDTTPGDTTPDDNTPGDTTPDGSTEPENGEDVGTSISHGGTVTGRRGSWVSVNTTNEESGETVTTEAYIPTGISTYPEDAYAHWAEDYIFYVYDNGIMTGYEDGTFLPARAITRAEFCTALLRYLGLEPDTENSFSDTEGHWASGMISRMAALGVVSGYDDGTFRPDNQISRQEVAAMLDRAFSPAATQTDVQPFADKSEIASWAETNVANIRAAGIMVGNGFNMFEPTKPITRAEVATILTRLHRRGL